MNQSALLLLLSTAVGSYAAAPSLRGVQSKPKTETRQLQRSLQETIVMGECSLTNFQNAAGGEAALLSDLGLDSITEDELKAMCAAALTDQM